MYRLQARLTLVLRQNDLERKILPSFLENKKRLQNLRQHSMIFKLGDIGSEVRTSTLCVTRELCDRGKPGSTSLPPFSHLQY